MPVETTILIIPKPKKNTKHGIGLVLNPKRMEQNIKTKYDLREEK